MSKFDEAAPQRTKTKVGEVLKFRDGGLSVEDARKAMLAAGQAPSGMVARSPQVEATVVPEPIVPAVVLPAVIPPVVADVIETDFEDDVEVPKPPVALVIPAAQAVPSTPQKIERVENAQFLAEIKQENGKWVAEIRYKNGSGTERFVADTKNQLMVKLLEGKGHATLRVNKAVRREKLGWAELDRQYPLPEGISTEDFDKMGDKQQDHLLLTVATQQTIMFREAHPEFYRDPENKNAKKLSDFLGEHKLPITLRNLEYAFDELTDIHLPAEVRLEEKPGVQLAPVITGLEQPAPATAPARMDSAPIPAVAPPAVPTPGVPVGAAVTVRKRGTTGLQPGNSSSEPEPVKPEGGSGPRQLSEAEARKMPLNELSRIVRAERARNSTQR
jgi:hypothetical protein